jgi:hypothetical protein
MFAAINRYHTDLLCRNKIPRGKNSFPVRNFMSHDSLAKLRNLNLDKRIYSLTLSEREPEIINHYEAELLRAELFVTTASRHLLWSRDVQK